MSYINIRGRGLKFNQGAIMWMQDKLDINNTTATAGYATAWGALKANAYVKGEEFTNTFEQVCDWVDELTQEEALSISECFKQSKIYSKLTPNDEPLDGGSDDEKKSPLQEPNTEPNVTASGVS